MTRVDRKRSDRWYREREGIEYREREDRLIEGTETQDRENRY